MKFAKKIPVVVMGVILLGFPVLVYFNAQNLVDWWKLRGYTPPASVSALASEDTMTKYATHVFYVNHPQIVSDTATFRQDCSENEQTIVLGCYHPEQEGIFVYNVSDPRLSGVQQVTAAHEMLHAVYARLSTKDRKPVLGKIKPYKGTSQLSHPHDPRNLIILHAGTLCVLCALCVSNSFPKSDPALWRN